MAGIKGNRRTLYTKMIIRESLIKLLKEKEIHKITVTDICKEADINRGTFYAHYNDPFDLLEKMEDDFFEKVMEYLNENSHNQDTITALTKIFEMARENKDFCKILLNNVGDDKILKRILYIANQDNINILISNLNDQNRNFIEYLTCFAVNGAVGIIEAWIKNDFQEDPKVLATLITTIALKLKELS